MVNNLILCRFIIYMFYCYIPPQDLYNRFKMKRIIPTILCYPKQNKKNTIVFRV